MVLSQDSCEKFILELKNQNIWSLNKSLDKIDSLLSSTCSKSQKRDILLLRAKYRTNMRQFELAIEDLLYAREISDGTDVKLQLAGNYASLERYYDAYIEWAEFHKTALLENDISKLLSSQIVLGNIYIQLGQTASAKKAVDKAIVYSKMINGDKAYQMSNSLLTAYWFNEGEIDSALYYLKEGESYESISEINPLRTFNKGVVFSQIGDIDNASLYFSKLLLEADQIGNSAFIGMAKYGLSQIELDNDKSKAFELLKEALTIIKTEDPKLAVFICECVLDNFSGEEYNELLPFFKKEQTRLKDSYNKMTEAQLSGLFETSAESFEEILMVKEAFTDERSISEIAKNKNKTLLTIVLIGSIFSIVLIFILVKMVKLKNKNEALIFDQNTALNAITIRLIHLESLNSEVINKLKRLALNQPSKATSDAIYEIANMLKIQVAGSASSELNDLDNLIQSINEGYVKKLCERFPSLTSSELMLAIYIRMNLSTKQIADMKGVSANSVDVARSRLRKKMGLTGSNIDLTNYLNRQ